MNIILGLMLFYLYFVYHLFTSTIKIFVPEWFKKKKNIAGKRILITGAGSGLGRQLAIEFSKYSVCLILVDINRKSLLQTEKLLDRLSSVFIYDCDVSDYKKVYEMAEKIKTDVGDVDILVNNAGIVSGNNLLELPEEKIIKTMEVNALAHFWMCKAFLPAMKAKNEGHIVSITSILGKKGAPRLTDYSASKFAAVGFSEALELELMKEKLDGISVTIVYPTLMDTGLFAGAKIVFGGVVQPERAAKEIVAGVLRGDDTIYLPTYFQQLFMIREFLPRYLLNKLLEATGSLDGMDTFTGRTIKTSKVANCNKANFTEENTDADNRKI